MPGSQEVNTSLRHALACSRTHRFHLAWLFPTEAFWGKFSVTFPFLPLSPSCGVPMQDHDHFCAMNRTFHVWALMLSSCALAEIPHVRWTHIQIGSVHGLLTPCQLFPLGTSRPLLEAITSSRVDPASSFLTQGVENTGQHPCPFSCLLKPQDAFHIPHLLTIVETVWTQPGLVLFSQLIITTTKHP